MNPTQEETFSYFQAAKTYSNPNVCLLPIAATYTKEGKKGHRSTRDKPEHTGDGWGSSPAVLSTPGQQIICDSTPRQLPFQQEG